MRVLLLDVFARLLHLTVYVNGVRRGITEKLPPNDTSPAG